MTFDRGWLSRVLDRAAADLESLPEWARPVVVATSPPADVDDRVAAWHAAPPGSAAAGMPLHEYLGLSWEQYRAWVADPDYWIG